MDLFSFLPVLFLVLSISNLEVVVVSIEPLLVHPVDVLAWKTHCFGKTCEQTDRSCPEASPRSSSRARVNCFNLRAGSEETTLLR